MAKPCCPKCGCTKIATELINLGGIMGTYIYCAECGAIITWIPKPLHTMITE